jgi:hypothetical protein
MRLISDNGEIGFWVENDAAYFFHDADNFSQEGVVGAGLRGGRFFTSAEAFAIV